MSTTECERCGGINGGGRAGGLVEERKNYKQSSMKNQ